MSNTRAEMFKRVEAQNMETITYATNTINDVAGEMNPTIPEELFVKYFLPMFAGEPKENYPETAAQEWMRISIKGMSRVNVVNKAGETVAVVPARYARSLVNIRTERGRVALSDSMQTFSDLASSSPPRAMAYYQNVIMPTTGDRSDIDKVMGQYIADMKKLLSYFGKNTDFLNTTVNNNDSEQDDNTPARVDDNVISDDELL